MRNTILYLIVIAGLFFSCSNNKTIISPKEFDQLLYTNSIKAITIQNNKDRVAIIKRGPNFNGEEYELEINSIVQFKGKLDDFEREYRSSNEQNRPYELIYVSRFSLFQSILNSGIVPSLLFTCLIVLFLFAAVDILKNQFGSDIQKLIWILMVIFIPFIGSILYLFIGRKQKIK